MDRSYEYRNSMKKLYSTNPYNPVIGRWKQPKKENDILKLETKDINKRINVWNENRKNNFLYHKTINYNKGKNNDINDEYDSAKHPEVYHRIESIKKIKHKQRINREVYKRSLKRNHHIITNQAWKGRKSIKFPLGDLKLKHAVLWKP